MRLFATMLRISVKRSGLRLLCFFAMLALGAGLTAAVLALRPQQEVQKSVIGVVNRDEHPIAQAALRLLAGDRELEPLFELAWIDEQQAREGGYAAVLFIPEGFTQSIMNGENLPPRVELNPATPLEAMWARQLASAAARYLGSAQLGVVSALELAGGAQDQELVLRINTAFASAFLNRHALLEQKTISAAGALSLPRYYACAIPAVLALCYGFLYAPAVLAARAFGRGPGVRRGALWLAAYAHTVLLGLAAALAVALALSVRLTAGTVGNLALFAALTGSFALLAASVARSEAACAAFALLCGLALGLVSGCVVPPGLMPPAFGRVAVWSPARLGTELLLPLAGGAQSAAVLWRAAAVTLALLAVSALLWLRESRTERGLEQ